MGVKTVMLGYADQTLNHDFFDTWTKESAYIFGLIASDGCITGKKENILKLASIDYSLISSYKQLFSSSNKIAISDHLTGQKGQRSYALQFTSNKLTDNLKLQGITPRKSLTLQWKHNCPDHLLSHLVRGYFDGDGTVSFGHTKKKTKFRQIAFFGTQHFLYGIANTISNILNIDSSSYQYETRKISILKYTKLDDLRKIIEWIYNDSSPLIRLDRKYDKMQILANMKYQNEEQDFGIRFKYNRWIAVIDEITLGTFDTKQEAIDCKNEYLKSGIRTNNHWKYYQYDGENKTLAAWAKDPRCQVSQSFLRKRVLSGMSLEEAFKPCK